MIIHYCSYCQQIETTSNGVNRLTHTHYPGKDKKPGWTNVYSTTSDLWAFASVEEMVRSLARQFVDDKLIADLVTAREHNRGSAK